MFELKWPLLHGPKNALTIETKLPDGTEWQNKKKDRRHGDTETKSEMTEKYLLQMELNYRMQSSSRC